MVEVYRFKVWNAVSGTWVVARLKSTRRRIEQMKGIVIVGTAEDVDETNVSPDGHYIPSKTEIYRGHRLTAYDGMHGWKVESPVSPLFVGTAHETAEHAFAEARIFIDSRR